MGPDDRPTRPTRATIAPTAPAQGHGRVDAPTDAPRSGPRPPRHRRPARPTWTTAQARPGCFVWRRTHTPLRTTTARD